MNADQVQAAANVAAVLLTGGVLWWEVHSRNRERCDAEAGQARTVFTEVRPGQYTGREPDRLLHEYEFVVTNHTVAPI